MAVTALSDKTGPMSPPEGAWDRPWGSGCYKDVALNGAAHRGVTSLDQDGKGSRLARAKLLPWVFCRLNSEALSNAYEQVVWVYRAINAIAEQVANIPFRFSSTVPGNEHVLTSGPLLDFYEKPHPHINRFQYWELRIIWLMLRGECFRIPIYGETNGQSQMADGKRGLGSGRLNGVLILDPGRNRLVGWRYIDCSLNTPLSSQVFLPEEVWHEKLPNPFDFWRGFLRQQAAEFPDASPLPKSGGRPSQRKKQAQYSFLRDPAKGASRLLQRRCPGIPRSGRAKNPSRRRG